MTVVDPLIHEVRSREMNIRMDCLPVVPDDGDGGAAQPDGYIEASEVKAYGSSHSGGSAAGGETTLSQHCEEVGGVTGGGVLHGVAAARVWNRH